MKIETKGNNQPLHLRGNCKGKKPNNYVWTPEELAAAEERKKKRLEYLAKKKHGWVFTSVLVTFEHLATKPDPLKKRLKTFNNGTTKRINVIFLGEVIKECAHYSNDEWKEMALDQIYADTGEIVIPLSASCVRNMEKPVGLWVNTLQATPEQLDSIYAEAKRRALEEQSQALDLAT